MGSVVGLFTYPIKGCAPVALDDGELTPAGLRHDREFMVTGPDGVFRSQRRDPRLALIRPEVRGDELRLRAPGIEPVAVPVDTVGPRRSVRLFSADFLGIDQGALAAEWLSTVLGVPSRLVRVPPEHDRVVSGATPGTSGWADSAALHVLAESSLADLNARLAEPLPMARFRPNVVVDDVAGPYGEDRVQAAEVGTAAVAFCKPAIRCVVTVVDQETGVKTGKEPLRTLAGYRRHESGGVAFGAKFSVTRPGTLAVGDAFTVTAWA
ncbi:MOSC domain-containing protein [Actinokineospora sp. UTMC 2448]|uniref:MOSC domain-containing protein n=1 Tax=Actinokineospora sp. UTMC 2448 TaxID=2268449 RepID=UPI00216463DC|nr:MOSC N-terminal beta barrel domain-containing protein [Actinokineospora sp. UTMC 2448]UVS77377.1 putative Fe-S protein [Actinokineospora sp. UTMC 2448]